MARSGAGQRTPGAGTKVVVVAGDAALVVEAPVVVAPVVDGVVTFVV
jgi:hypothetical protein